MANRTNNTNDRSLNQGDLTLVDAYEIVGGYKEANKSTYELAMKLVEKDDAEFAKSLKSLKKDNSDATLKNLINIYNAYEIAGGYKKADDATFDRAMKIVEKDDAEFAESLRRASQRPQSPKSGLKVSAEELEKNISAVNYIFTTNKNLKYTIFDDKNVKSAMKNTYVYNVSTASNVSSSAQPISHDDFWGIAEANAVVDLAENKDFSVVSEEVQKQIVVEEVTKNICATAQQGRVQAVFENADEEKIEAIKTGNKGFFSTKLKQIRKAFDLETIANVTEGYIEKKYEQVKNKFRSFTKKITDFAKTAKGQAKRAFSRSAVALNKVALYCTIFATLAPSFTACNHKSNENADINNLTFTNKATVEKDDPTKTLNFVDAKVDAMKKNEKTDSIATTVAVADIVATQEVQAKDEVAETKKVYFNDGIHYEPVAFQQGYSGVDNDVPNNAMALDHDEARGGYQNMGITNKQYNRMRNFFKSKYGEDAYDHFLSKITDDMRQKGGVFEGLSKEQSLFTVQQMIAWSNDETGAFAPQIKAIMTYFQGCDEHLSAEMSAKIKQVVDAVNVDGTIDGITGTSNVVVNSFKSNDCNKAGTYNIQELDTKVQTTTPSGKKFVRLFDYEIVEEPIVEEKVEVQEAPVVLEEPAPVVEEAPKPMGTVYKGDFVYIENVAPEKVLSKIDLSQSEQMTAYVPGTSQNSVEDVQITQKNNKAGAVYKGDNRVFDGVAPESVISEIDLQKSNQMTAFTSDATSDKEASVTELSASQEAVSSARSFWNSLNDESREKGEAYDGYSYIPEVSSITRTDSLFIAKALQDKNLDISKDDRAVMERVLKRYIHQSELEALASKRDHNDFTRREKRIIAEETERNTEIAAAQRKPVSQLSRKERRLLKNVKRNDEDIAKVQMVLANLSSEATFDYRNSQAKAMQDDEKSQFYVPRAWAKRHGNSLESMLLYLNSTVNNR